MMHSGVSTAEMRSSAAAALEHSSPSSMPFVASSGDMSAPAGNGGAADNAAGKPLSPHRPGGHRGGAASSRAAAWSAAGLFFVTSTTTVFINKAIFRVYSFDAPATLVTGQMLFSIGLLYLSTALPGKRGGLAIRVERPRLRSLLRVGPLSALFLTKLILDMSALALINIPMYGVLKSITSLFVIILEGVLRNKTPGRTVFLSVMVTTLGGLIAGAGDLTFNLTGYALALASAGTTAAYVVVVGILADDFKMDSFTMLMYNAIWSAPVAALILVANGELAQVRAAVAPRDARFFALFLLSCVSAFVLNLSTYLCTLRNSPLTTSVVARTKTILQGFMGLFAFGDVIFSSLNLLGLLLNTVGVGWYAAIKISGEMQRGKETGWNGEAERGGNLLPTTTTAATDKRGGGR